MKPDTLRVENEHLGTTTILRPIGEIGVAGSEKFDAAVTVVIARHPALVVIDASQLTFLSSIGMGSFVRLNKSVKQHNGQVRLAGATAGILQSLMRARLNDVFTFHPDVESALKA